MNSINKYVCFIHYYFNHDFYLDYCIQYYRTYTLYVCIYADFILSII